MLLALALGTATAAAVAALPFGFVHHGSFVQMVQTGDTTGTLALDALPQGPGRWGVGATAGLAGEIVQLDGRVWVSPGGDPSGRVRPPAPGEAALLFAGGRVTAWQARSVPRDLDGPAFEAFVRAEAASAGLDAEQPFVLRVEGRFPDLQWHVVDGPAMAMPSSRSTPGTGHGGNSGHMGNSGHGGHGRHGALPHGPAPDTATGTPPHGHANKRHFEQREVDGQLVGVSSGAALEGIVSHPGERLHLHYVSSDHQVSGHVDHYRVAAGSTLWLPRPAAPR